MSDPSASLDEPAASVEPMMRLPGRTVLELLAILASQHADGAVAIEWNRRLASEVHRLREHVAKLAALLERPAKGLSFSREARLPLLHLVAQQKLVSRPVLTPSQYDRRFVRLCDRMAAVISQTYVERGEEATLADDQALLRLRDLLLDFDETIFLRNATRPQRTAKRQSKKARDCYDREGDARSG